jgi:divalent metal cation (Fe/Co/Zn/Cd) transporter
VTIDADEKILPAIHRSKDPATCAVLFEDSAAILGLFVAFLGISLAQLLNSRISMGEARGLLIGEGARSTALKTIRQLVETDPAVEKALTMYLGPETVLLALDVLFKTTLSANEATTAVNRIEKAVRAKFPRIRHIYLEAASLSAPSRSGSKFFPQYHAEGTH